MPDLDHARRDEHVGLAAGKRVPSPRALPFVAHLTVDHRNAEVAELGPAEPLTLARGRTRLELLGLLDERADHEHCRPAPNLARG